MRRRRPSNKIIRHIKQREKIVFSPKGNLNTVLVLYIFTSSERRELLTEREELLLKINFSTDTTIVLAVLRRCYSPYLIVESVSFVLLRDVPSIPKKQLNYMSRDVSV